MDDRESIVAVHRALDLGVNFFDTADVYGLGHAEEVLGQALRARKHEAIVATKFGVRWDEQGKTTRDLTPTRVVEALEGSLRRLDLERIDLYQIHWHDQRTPIEETIDALKKCQENGKVRYVGCCNFSIALVAEAQKYGRLESLQLPYSLAERDYENTIRYCAEQFKVTILCYNPLAQGLFTGKYGRYSSFGDTDLRLRSHLFDGKNLEANLVRLERLKLISEHYGRTPSQVAIRWILDTIPAACAITGIKSTRQIEENVGAFTWRLSMADLEFLGIEPSQV